LQQNEIQISMDGRGRCRNNAKIERFWWALKYEDIKIKDYVSLPQLRFDVQHYVNFYNAQRIHSALQYKTPDEVYFSTCNSTNRGYISSRPFTPIF
jgi:putative transposase